MKMRLPTFGELVFLLFSSVGGLLATFTNLYMCGFITNLVVPVTVDYSPEWHHPPFRLEKWPFLNNLLLLLLFGLQHSSMPRGIIKKLFTTIISEKYYRPFYVMVASCLLLATCYLWIPLPVVVWEVEHPVLKNAILALSGLSWTGTAVALVVLNPLELTGMQETVDSLFGWKRDTSLVTTGLYGLVRHPTYSFLIASYWITPRMTVGHMLMAGVYSAYILLAVPLYEEPDLVKHLGPSYVKNLMDELIETEESYIRDLTRVVEEYMPAMDSLQKVPKKLLGKKNYVFSTIPQLLEINKRVFQPGLLSCERSPLKLGEVFLTFEEDLLVYSMYFKNMPQQSQLMEEGGVEFFGAVSRHLGDQFPLSSYLIKPFQRMTKYKQFLSDLAKHYAASDLNSEEKEHLDKLQHAFKVVDFALRHGNDLLALECLKGFKSSVKEQGKLIRQGDLVLVCTTKQRKRRVFLFEDTLLLTKKRKPKKEVGSIAGSEYFDFKAVYKTKDYSLRENVEGHPSRFELYSRNNVLTFMARNEEEKQVWVQDIWDLFFSHMLSLKDQNLEMHASQPLSSLQPEHSVTLRRPFGKSIRRTLSNRRSVRLSANLEVENEYTVPQVEVATQESRLRVLVGGVCVLLSWSTFIFMSGFVADMVVPVTVDHTPQWYHPPCIEGWEYLNCLLLLSVGVLIRLLKVKAVKKAITFVIPEFYYPQFSVVVLSLFVLLSLLMWTPLPQLVWEVHQPLLCSGIFGVRIVCWVCAVVTMLCRTVDNPFGILFHWDSEESRELLAPSTQLSTQLLFMFFIWLSSRMTLGHLLFSSLLTLYTITAAAGNLL